MHAFRERGGHSGGQHAGARSVTLERGGGQRVQRGELRGGSARKEQSREVGSARREGGGEGGGEGSNVSNGSCKL